MKKLLVFLLVAAIAVCSLAGCNLSDSASGGMSGFPGGSGLPGGNMPGGEAGGGMPDQSQTSSSDGTTADKTDSEKTDIPSDLEEGADTLTVACSEGTDNCWQLNGQTLTFSGVTADTVCSVAGEFNGGIVIDVGDDYKFELELCGVTIYSGECNPVTILSGDKVTLTAKKGYKNFIYDTRAAVDDADETVYSAAVYAKCDLELGGKGELVVISENNNGIHTKDDLKVKNLTLSVTCEDNALKGNDSVTVSGGALTLIAKSGDGIKTKNTDISSKGNQRGTIALSGGTINIYAACDGIDAAYNAEVGGDVMLNVYTDKYSPYSESVEKTESARYIRFTSDSYKYSVKYYNGADDYKWVNAVLSKTVNGGRSTYYYYSFDKLEGYKSMQFYIYSSAQSQGQDADYVLKTDFINWNESYDTLAFEYRRNAFTYNFVNYTTSISGGFPGGGMSDGNTDKGDYSTKGIKADNEVVISGGTITVNSYDDCIHANGGETLENAATSLGSVTIGGGTLTLFSKDDGVHADGTLTVTGGKITITGSYEGLEGDFVVIKGGDISIVSSDDGINATTTSGTGISFDDGKVYVYAGGDGLDSNSRTSYSGILFAGGEIIVVSTSGGNSSIDTEQGYSYTGGKVLAICPSNGMANESLNCQNFSSFGCKTNLNLTQGQTLAVGVDGETALTLEMPCKLSALVIYLGSSNAKFSVA